MKMLHFWLQMFWCCWLVILNRFGSFGGEHAGFTILNVDVNDIFNAHLMPMELLSQEEMEPCLLAGNSSIDKHVTWPMSLEINKGPPITLTSGSANINAALEAMLYHREKINEFLVTDYLAKQILNDGADEVLPGDMFPIAKRMGEAQNATQDAHKKNHSVQANVELANNHKLLGDEGMTRYKTWLQRTTTLDDIQRQMGHTAAANRKPKRRRPEYNRRQGVDFEMDSSESETDFEDADVTGYATATNPSDDQNVPLVPAGSDLHSGNPYMQTVNKNGYESGYDDYGIHAPPPHAYASHQEVHIPIAPPVPKEGKEISIKDITDIALTTLAFLSFGMFILQVLMCITMGKDDTNNMMMLPMEATDSSEVPGDGVEEIRRKRRSLPNSNARLILMNELARRALFSIDAVLDKFHDDDSCHYWSLCENNRYAKEQPNGQKYWIPVWSLGMSWLTTRVWKTESKSTAYLPIIKSLKAIAVGLANGSCEQFYQNASCKQKATKDKNK